MDTQFSKDMLLNKHWTMLVQNTIGMDMLIERHFNHHLITLNELIQTCICLYIVAYGGNLKRISITNSCHDIQIDIHC